MKLLLLCALVGVSVHFITAENYKRPGDYYINSLAFQGSSFGGCRKKHPDNRSLPGGAEACVSHKPIKVKGVAKNGKRLCSDGYEYCSISHKSLNRISWKPEIMPTSCFAFHYKKDKFAGYGHNCHRNLYFDGLLCCPIDEYTNSQKHRIGSDKFQKHRFSTWNQSINKLNV